MIGWILLAAFAVFSYLYSLWFIVGIIVLSLWKVNHWYYYSSRPWKRIHFPLMRLYASAAGYEAGLAEREGREFDVEIALRRLFELAGVSTEAERLVLVQKLFDTCSNFYDENDMKSYLLEKKGLSEDGVEPILSKMRDILSNPDNGLLVRMAAASIIEDRYSTEDRMEYLMAVFTGRAN